MKISRLLEHHKKFADKGLPENFGDGYLVANNRFYAQVRKAALKYGYRFSAERNDAYETFPLLQLDAILKAKILPFSNNMAAFKSLNAIQLEALQWEDVEGNLKKNFVFHEGCHAFVRELANKSLGAKPAAGADIQSQREFALRLLIEESCANTAELLGIVDVHDQVHRIFFEMNSYMENFENRTHLKNALAEIGEAVVIQFMVLAYLQANLLRKGFEDKEFNAMIDMVSSGDSLNPKKIKTLRALGKTAFQLSERFRVQTTGFHLRIAGIQSAPVKIFDFDALKSLEKSGGSSLLNEFSSELLKV